jgi:hypothetical protein
MEFNIGDKVLCIANPVRPTPKEKIQPKIGTEYTIRGRGIDGEGLLLIEIINKIYPLVHYRTGQYMGYGEPGFCPSRFMKWNPEEETIEIKEKAEVTV